MGLDAVVYKHIENLPERLQAEVRIVDPETGELEFVTYRPPDQHYDSDILFAENIRIGNISRVAWLREQIQSRWPGRCSAILKAVLYSGTHSGDFIPLEGVRRIRHEIEEIDWAEASVPAELAAFFAQIRKLLDAAEREKNPLVFQ